MDDTTPRPAIPNFVKEATAGRTADELEELIHELDSTARFMTRLAEAGDDRARYIAADLNLRAAWLQEAKWRMTYGATDDAKVRMARMPRRF